MAITEKQYETILSALADKIKSQEETISLQRWKIEKLEKTLEEAENVGKATPEKIKIGFERKENEVHSNN